MKRFALAICCLAAALLFAAPARAESVAELAKQLLGDSDSRVRMQAALALGASASSDAVSPLCKGLADGTDAVRAAAAAGLGRLARGGKSCLEDRKKKEQSSNVLKMIDKAIGLITEALEGPNLASAKYYIAIGKLNAKASRQAEIVSYARSAIRRSLGGKSGFAFAPAGESKDDAKKRLRKYPAVAGYSLAGDVLVEYAGGNLTVEIQVSIYGYPDMSSQGSLSQFAGDSADEEDAEKEKALVDEVVKKAMNKFAKMAASVD